MTTESSVQLPAWAAEMRQQFRTGSASQFVLSGNVFDLVAAATDGDEMRFVSLRRFLTEVMLAPFDVIVHYDRGRGIRVRKGGAHFHGFLKAFDSFKGISSTSVKLRTTVMVDFQEFRIMSFTSGLPTYWSERLSKLFEDIKITKKGGYW